MPGRRPGLRHPARSPRNRSPRHRTPAVRRLATRPASRGRAHRHACELRPSVARLADKLPVWQCLDHVRRKSSQSGRTHGRATGSCRRRRVGQSRSKREARSPRRSRAKAGRRMAWLSRRPTATSPRSTTVCKPPAFLSSAASKAIDSSSIFAPCSRGRTNRSSMRSSARPHRNRSRKPHPSPAPIEPTAGTSPYSGLATGAEPIKRLNSASLARIAISTLRYS